MRRPWNPSLAGGVAGAIALVVATASAPLTAQQPSGARDVTFYRDVVPILQRSCQSCHRPNSLAPMSQAASRALPAISVPPLRP